MHNQNEQINELGIVEKVFSQNLKELQQEQSLLRDLYMKGKVEDENLFHTRMIQLSAKIQAMEVFAFKTRHEINKEKNKEAGYKFAPNPSKLFQEGS